MGKVWEKSGQIERDNNDARAGGALAYFYAGGTTTPISVYQEAAESTPHEHPVEADSNGRWPFVSIPFRASYDVKVVTAEGTQLYYHVSVPNADPVEASVDSVDPNALLATGDVVWSPKSGTRSGFVRLNGRTIGSASSGASERANDDCEDLFIYYWDNLANSQASVSGGRGATAEADWAANKTITLLNGQSGLLMGLDDMGNTAAGLLASATFTNGNATTPGSHVGSNTQGIVESNLPAHTHTFSATTSSNGSHSHGGATGSDGAHSHTATVTDPTHQHAQTVFTPQANTAAGGGPAGGGLTSTLTAAAATGISVSISSATAHTHTISADGAHTHTVSGTTSTGSGSGTAMNIVSKSLLGTFYQKL